MTKRYLANIITQNPTAPADNFETTSAPGVWSLAEAFAYTKAGLWPTAGSKLYVVAVIQGGDLIVADVTDPSSQVVLGTVGGADTARGLTYDSVNQVVYVGENLSVSDLDAFDVSDPTAPVLLGSYQQGDSDDIRGHALSADGSILYAQSFEDGNFMTLDVSDPTTITQLDDISMTGGAIKFSVAVDYDADLCVVTLFGQNTVRVVDVSNPSLLSNVGSYTSASTVDGPSTVFLDTSLQNAFILAGLDEEVTALDYGTGGDPTFIASVSPAPSGGTNNYRQMTHDSDAKILYVHIQAITGNHAIASIDVSDPSSMTLLEMFESSSIPDQGSVMALVNNNKRLICAANDNTVTIDVSDPSNMSVLGEESIVYQYNAVQEYFI